MRKDIQLSRKPIRSSFGGTARFEIIDDKLMEARRNIRSCISISTRKELDDELQKIDELIGDAMTHTEMMKNGDYDASMFSSRKPIKSSSMKYGDFLNQLRKEGYPEEAISAVIADNAYMITEDDIYTDTDQRDFRRRLKNEISSGCHSKAKKTKKERPVKSSHNGEDICGMCDEESDILVEDLKEELGREGYAMDVVEEFFDEKELDDYDSLCRNCEGQLRKEFEKYHLNKSAMYSSFQRNQNNLDNIFKN